MTAHLSENSYGKNGIHVVKVVNALGCHCIKDLSVSVLCKGAFEDAFVAGDNRNILPTDTMKNVVYALAASQPLQTIEEFSLALADHYLCYEPIRQVDIAIEESIWDRAPAAGETQPATFVKSSVKRTASLRASRELIEIRSGIAELHLIKTTGSSFAGFMTDRFTTLPPTSSRLLQTSVQLTWGYTYAHANYTTVWERVRDLTVDTFAKHESKSVQHTLFAIAEAVLAGNPEIADVDIVLPNQHCQVVDLAPFGLENREEVFVPVNEPYGQISARVSRAEVAR